MPIVWVSFKLLTVTTILYNYFFSNESDTSEVKGGRFSFDLFFFSGFSVTTIHESQDYKGRGREFL